MPFKFKRTNNGQGGGSSPKKLTRILSLRLPEVDISPGEARIILPFRKLFNYYSGESIGAVTRF